MMGRKSAFDVAQSRNGVPASFKPSPISPHSRAGCSRRNLVKKCILMRPIMRLQRGCKIAFVFMVDRYLVHGHAVHFLSGIPSQTSSGWTRQLLKGLKRCMRERSSCAGGAGLAARGRGLAAACRRACRGAATTACCHQWSVLRRASRW